MIKLLNPQNYWSYEVRVLYNKACQSVSTSVRNAITQDLLEGVYHLLHNDRKYYKETKEARL